MDSAARPVLNSSSAFKKLRISFALALGCDRQARNLGAAICVTQHLFLHARPVAVMAVPCMPNELSRSEGFEDGILQRAILRREEDGAHILRRSLVSSTQPGVHLSCQ